MIDRTLDPLLQCSEGMEEEIQTAQSVSMHSNGHLVRPPRRPLVLCRYKTSSRECSGPGLVTCHRPNLVTIKNQAT